MDSFYLYGAGVNCKSVIRFFGSDLIEGIIDSNESLQGKLFDGIKVISLSEYLERNDGKTILITPYYVGQEISRDLKEQGITNTYRLPWMQTYLFSDCKNIISVIKDFAKGEFCFAYKDPLSMYIATIAEQENIVIKYAEGESGKKFRKMLVLSVLTEEEKRMLRLGYPDAELIYIGENNSLYNEENKELLKYKGVHKGDRCFIVGNGPSITAHDLDMLAENGEICFGVNRVYLGFEQTKWRPDYYVTVDEMIVASGLEGMKEYNCPKFVRRIYNVTSNNEGVELFDPIVQPLDGTSFSDDISKGIYMGDTVVYEAVQIAAYMGFSEIYLIGVDMTQGINYQDEGAHFYKSPDTSEPLGKGNSMNAIKCLEYASKHLENRGIRLFNATRNVWWNNVPKISLDKVLKKEG